MRSFNRWNMYSVMSNSGFGDLVMYSGDKKILVPQKYITKRGNIYKRVNEYILERNFEKLEELGVVVR